MPKYIKSAIYEIIYDYCDYAGNEERNIRETFEGTWAELREHIEQMRRDGCYNIDATYIEGFGGYSNEDEQDEWVVRSSKTIGNRKSKYVRASSNNNDEYSNIEVDVYDIAKFVEEDTDGKYALFNYDDGAAILFKPDGSGCIVDYEAIGESFDSMSDTVILELTDVPEKGKMFIAPQYQANVSIREIIDKSPHKTMTVDEFFTKRNYNSRCINNFNGIKEYLK
jgi:hypothetical protein